MPRRMKQHAPARTRPERRGDRPAADRSGQSLDLRPRRSVVRAVHRHRVARQSRIDRGFLRGRLAGRGARQRHGDRGRLDERRLVHFDGRHDVGAGPRRRHVSDGLDRRLRAAGAAVGAVSAQVRQIHGARFRGRAVLFADRAGRRPGVRHLRVVHLRCRTDARGRGGVRPVPRSAGRVGRGGRHGARVRLCGDRRPEGHHLHAGRPILRADLRLHAADLLHFVDDDRHAAAANGVRRGTVGRAGRCAAGQARRLEPGTGLRGLYRPRQQDGHRRFLHHLVADGRHRGSAARHHPLLHGPQRARRASVRGLGAAVHRHPVRQRAGGRRVRAHEHPDDRPRRRVRRHAGVVL